MSKAQIETYGELIGENAIAEHNHEVLKAVKGMPGQQGTYQQVIYFMLGFDPIPATEGNAKSAPIIRALSELAEEGWLDASVKVPNPYPLAKGQRARPNTLYRWVGRKLEGRPKETWKEYALRLEEHLMLLGERFAWRGKTEPPADDNDAGE